MEALIAERGSMNQQRCMTDPDRSCLRSSSAAILGGMSPNRAQNHPGMPQLSKVLPTYLMLELQYILCWVAYCTERIRYTILVEAGGSNAT